MPLSKIFKRILLPCAAGVTGAENFGPVCERKPAPGTKPSELPIYSKPCSDCGDVKTTSSPPSSMEEAVGNIRRELWVWQDNLKGYRHKIVDVYRQGFSKADCPETMRSRDRLEQSFQESKSCLNDESAAASKSIHVRNYKGFRSPWAVSRKLENLTLDRCGKPCSGNIRGSQYQKQNSHSHHHSHIHQNEHEHEQYCAEREEKEQQPQQQNHICQKHRPNCPVPQPKNLSVHGQSLPPCEGPRNQECICCQNAQRSNKS